MQPQSYDRIRRPAHTSAHCLAIGLGLTPRPTLRAFTSDVKVGPSAGPALDTDDGPALGVRLAVQNLARRGRPTTVAETTAIYTRKGAGKEASRQVSKLATTDDGHSPALAAARRGLAKGGPQRSRSARPAGP